MPSRENMFLLTSDNGVRNGGVPEFAITPLQVEELVSEIKENLRLSATSMKSRPAHLSRKLSRTSPYKIPSRCSNTCAERDRDNNKKCTCASCVQSNKRKCVTADLDDPYDLLQKLLRDGSLVQEAVRRVQLGLTPKQRYFYDSEEEPCSPALRFLDNAQCAQESAKCN